MSFRLRLSQFGRFSSGVAQEGVALVKSSSLRGAYGQTIRGFVPLLGLAGEALRVRRGQTVIHLLARRAKRDGEKPALLMDDTRWSWSEFASRVALVAKALDVRDKTVAVVASNSPEYLAVVLGIVHAGGRAALVNPSSKGDALRHAIESAGASQVVCDQARLAECRESFSDVPVQELMALCASTGDSETLDPKTADESGDCFYIYTSGTTGLPKSCRVTHGRVYLAGFGAAKAFGIRRDDVVYNCLPLFHSNALLLAFGACLASGAALAIRDGFSARAFWPDVLRYEATAFNYIGDVARFISESKHQPASEHSLRVAFGNGLREAPWRTLKSRFGIECIYEFYAATESPGGFINFGQRPGSVGQMLAPKRGKLVLAKVDDDGNLMRANSRVVEAQTGEAGELLVRVSGSEGLSALGFAGYTDPEATKKKMAFDVLGDGDAYFRTGDLLRLDEDNYVYFVDRMGDTFRWRGENVSTAEVECVLAAAGVVGTVVGVEVPGQEGRAGMLVIESETASLQLLSKTFVAHLSPAARPRFVRFMAKLPRTPTHKVQGATLRKEGVEPDKQEVFVLAKRGYEVLTTASWEAIKSGTRRI